jgi:hypothetical protein
VNIRPITATLAAVLLAGLAACQGKEETPYQVELPMKELMGHVIDPAAWQFWNYTGWVDDETGSHSRIPTTEEGWLDAETGAVTVAEASNLLLLPGRNQEDADWAKFAKQLYDASMEARQATIDKDEQAMFDTGGKMYEACVACHAKFLLPNLPPEEREATFAPLPDIKAKDRRETLKDEPPPTK